MKRRQVCAVLCAISMLSALFSGSMAVMAEEDIQTEAAAEQQTEAAPVETQAAEEQTEAAPEETEAAEEQTEETTEQDTENTDAVKIDRDNPEGRIGVAYDQPEAWGEIVMANDELVDTGINIRQTADEDGEVLGYLYQGCAAWVLNHGDEWTEIYSGGMTGFVKSEYLVTGDSARALAEKYGSDGITATWDGVAVFAEPDGESEVVKVLYTGDDMFVVSSVENWLEVKLSEDSTAYVFSGDIVRSLVLNSAVPKDGVYKAVELPEETEVYEETEETYEEEYAEETYVEPEYTEPSYDYVETPQTSAPQTEAPQTSAPQTEAPQTSAPQTEAPQTSAPQTEAPQTEAPQTEAPQTEAPQTEAPQTDAPQTEAPQTDAPQTDAAVDDGGDSDASIDAVDEGWYDADTDTYYDANGNVITQSANSAYAEETYTDDTYTEETYADDTYTEETYTDDAYATDDTYTEETYADDTYTEETYTDDAYTEDTYTESTEAASSSVDDHSLLAALIFCEAGNQSYEGMVAVGAVVMNRVNSSSFPGTISEVIYQSGQFTPASSGALASALASGVPSACYDAASAAMAGEDPTGGALYFNAGSGSGLQIGDHQFY